MRQLTDPIVRHINLIDVSLQGWTPGKVRGECSLAIYQIEGTVEKLLAQLLVYAGDDRENDRTRFPTHPRRWLPGAGLAIERRTCVYTCAHVGTWALASVGDLYLAAGRTQRSDRMTSLFVALRESAFGRYCCKSPSGYEAHKIDSSAVFPWQGRFKALCAGERTLRSEPIELTFATLSALLGLGMTSDLSPQRVEQRTSPAAFDVADLLVASSAMALNDAIIRVGLAGGIGSADG